MERGLDEVNYDMMTISTFVYGLESYSYEVLCNVYGLECYSYEVLGNGLAMDGLRRVAMLWVLADVFGHFC